MKAGGLGGTVQSTTWRIFPQNTCPGMMRATRSPGWSGRKSQTPLRTPIGTLFPDCLWEDHRVIGECDGAVKYADGSAAFLAEKQREQVLRDLGYGMVRWLAKEIMARPEVVVARVARALDR